METDVCGFADVWFLLCGKTSFSALGCTSVEVSMKKMRSRKMMSVIDDMLNDALIFCPFLSAMAVGSVVLCRGVVEHVHELHGARLERRHDLVYAAHEVVVGEVGNDADYESADCRDQGRVYASGQ